MKTRLTFTQITFFCVFLLFASIATEAGSLVGVEKMPGEGKSGIFLDQTLFDNDNSLGDLDNDRLLCFLLPEVFESQIVNFIYLDNHIISGSSIQLRPQHIRAPPIPS